MPFTSSARTPFASTAGAWPGFPRAADAAAVSGRPTEKAADASVAAANGSTNTAAAADLASLSIRAALDRLTGALARAVAAFVSLHAWTVFGFARLDDHARERCGRSGRWFRDLAALGDGIAAAPRLADALTGADGDRPLGRVAATLVARALAARPGGLPARPGAGDPDDWIAAARCLSVRDLRAAIRLARAGGADAGNPTASPDEDAATNPDADRVLLRLPVPSPILPAFDEALDLHRAVEGYASSVTAFVESLVGEALAGGAAGPSCGLVRPLEHGTPEAHREAALRRASAAWSALPDPLAAPLPEPLPATSAGNAGGMPDLVSRFGALEAVAGEGDAVELDRQIRALIDIETALEAELGRLLALMTERGDWARLQFTGVGHYAEERLGMSRSRAGERARLARALRSLPAVADACASGRISMESAALIHRILTDAGDDGAPGGDSIPGGDGLPDLEAAWVEHAASITIKRMRDEARALGRYRARAYASNAAPCGPARGPAMSRPLADGPWCASLRREAGTATRRILEFGLRAAGFALGAAGREPTHDATEPDVSQVDGPATVPEPDVFQAEARATAAEPDATLRLRLPAEVAADFLAAIETARDAVEARVATVPWDEPWPPDEAGHSGSGAGAAAASAGATAAEWAARVSFIRGRRVPMWVGLLALLEDFAATWDTDAAAPERRDDRVFIRDGWRCMAPGCSSRRNLEDHHVVYRSHGGDDRPANRVTLCRFHHQRGEHGDLMSVRGLAPGALTWRLGRSDVAVSFRNERRLP